MKKLILTLMLLAAAASANAIIAPRTPYKVLQPDGIELTLVNHGDEFHHWTSTVGSESQIKGIHSFTIVVNSTKETVEKVVKQIDKLVEVIKAFYYEEEQLIAQELALYKMPMAAIKMINMGRFIRENNARILDMQQEYFVIEKTGTAEQTQELLEKLRPLGILEFIRSGRVIITKPMKTLDEYMDEKNQSYSFTN